MPILRFPARGWPCRSLSGPAPVGDHPPGGGSPSPWIGRKLSAQEPKGLGRATMSAPAQLLERDAQLGTADALLAERRREPAGWRWSRGPRASASRHSSLPSPSAPAPAGRRGARRAGGRARAGVCLRRGAPAAPSGASRGRLPPSDGICSPAPPAWPQRWLARATTRRARARPAPETCIPRCTASTGSPPIWGRAAAVAAGGGRRPVGRRRVAALLRVPGAPPGWPAGPAPAHGALDDGRPPPDGPRRRACDNRDPPAGFERRGGRGAGAGALRRRRRPFPGGHLPSGHGRQPVPGPELLAWLATRGGPGDAKVAGGAPPTVQASVLHRLHRLPGAAQALAGAAAVLDADAEVARTARLARLTLDQAAARSGRAGRGRPPGERAALRLRARAGAPGGAGHHARRGARGAAPPRRVPAAGGRRRRRRSRPPPG